MVLRYSTHLLSFAYQYFGENVDNHMTFFLLVLGLVELAPIVSVTNSASYDEWAFEFAAFTVFVDLKFCRDHLILKT